MFAIHYPEPAFRIKKEKEKDYIFDTLRKKWLLLTPEEWVRQNFIQYLVQVKQYPSSLIAQEKQISVGELSKRFDILVYDQHHQPRLLVECKAPSVPLSDEVVHQMLRYHSRLQAVVLVVTNGEWTAAWQKEGGILHDLLDIPEAG